MKAQKTELNGELESLVFLYFLNARVSQIIEVDDDDIEMWSEEGVSWVLSCSP